MAGPVRAAGKTRPGLPCALLAARIRRLREPTLA